MLKVWRNHECPKVGWIWVRNNWKSVEIITTGDLVCSSDKLNFSSLGHFYLFNCLVWAGGLGGTITVLCFNIFLLVIFVVFYCLYHPSLFSVFLIYPRNSSWSSPPLSPSQSGSLSSTNRPNRSDKRRQQQHKLDVVYVGLDNKCLWWSNSNFQFGLDIGLDCHRLRCDAGVHFPDQSPGWWKKL